MSNLRYQAGILLIFLALAALRLTNAGDFAIIADLDGVIYAGSMGQRLADLTQLPLSGLESPTAVDYDPVDQMVYWTDTATCQSQISRAHLNGSNQMTVVDGLGTPDGLALDVVGRMVYWTDDGLRHIGRAPMDGNGSKEIILEELDHPRGIITDQRYGHIYWTDWGVFPKIERADFNGSNRTTIVDNDLVWPIGITIDFDENYLYWCDAYLGKIERSDLLGNNRMLVKDIDFFFSRPFSIAVYNDYLYWTSWFYRAVRRTHVNGTAELDFGPTAFRQARDIRIAREPDYCNSFPCKTGGTCVDVINGFSCQCPAGYDGPTCELADLRIVGNTTRSEGRLEIYMNGSWGTVCNNSWGIEEAHVACRQLGFPAGAIEATQGGSYGSADGPIHLDDVVCSGQENYLANCQHAGVGIHNCSHASDAGVQCSPSVRLVDGSSPNEGRVEVFWNGAWGTVCDDGWDFDDATVVCRQLGFIGVRVEALSQAPFGGGHGLEIVLDDLVCDGDEETLFDCRHRGPGRHNCDHMDDAGVRCADVRFVGGRTRNEGRVEVLLNDGWGTVCDNSWGLEDAQVACRQLGFPGATEAIQGGAYGRGSGPIHFSNMTCSGEESNLQTCQHGDIGVSNCTHVDDAGVVCSPAVRLVGGASSNEGRVEVFYRGDWGTVCDDLWNLDDATVVCRELGFSRATDYPSFGGGCSLDILLDNLQCTGDEETLFGCRHNGLRNHNCGHHEDAGVRCDLCENELCLNGGTCHTVSTRIICVCPTRFSGPTCAYAGLRLVGGGAGNEGRLEIFLNGEWGTVCDDLWGQQDAQVACRQLGFPGAVEPTLGGSYGRGTGPIHLDDVYCSGPETNLGSCQHGGLGFHNCSHDEDAGVVCDHKVRLINGSSPNEGRVEVYWNGTWGTVCDNYWGISDATVICRELGYSRAVSALRHAAFGQGVGLDILLDKVACTGNEETIFDCPLRGFGTDSCGHHKDAGVRCDPCDSGPCLNGGTCTSNPNGFTCRCTGGDSGPICQFAELRLIGGTTRNEGRIEIYLNDEWGTVCDDSWGPEEHQVACRQLGFPDVMGATTLSPGPYGNGSGPIHLYNVTCTGLESSLESCQHGGVVAHNCTHSTDVAIACAPAVRLVEGSSANEGRVEVFTAGAWGTICDDGWDLNDANVVCRELGFDGATRALSNAFFGSGFGLDVLLDDLNCLGDEETVFDCEHGGVGNHKCGHFEDAGVKCEVLRLVGGRSRNEGRLEIFFNGEWGTVCNNSWGYEDTQVACRQLNFPNASTSQGGSYGVGNGPIHLDNVACTGLETTLETCPHSGIGVNNCTHTQDVGIACVPAVRLIEGLTLAEGRVEVFDSGVWRSVCTSFFGLSSWGLREADVVCRELGFPGAAQAVQWPAAGEWFVVDVLQGVECQGDEKTLLDCQHEAFGLHSCPSFATVGVRCILSCEIPSEQPELDVYSPGDSIEYSCADGYQLRGSTQRTCQSDLTWSGQPAECIEDPCVTGPCLNGGNCTSAEGEYTCLCPAGYVGPRCEDVAHCVITQDPSAVVPDQQDVYLPGDSVQYACPDGYHLNGSTVRICLSNFTWSGQPAVCIQDPCDSRPCGNGGTCMSTSKGFTCLCGTGFKGSTCAGEESTAPVVGGVVGGVILIIVLVVVAAFITMRFRTRKGPFAGLPDDSSLAPSITNPTFTLTSKM